MNNVNGAALEARVKAGDLVTVRLADGSTRKGRAHLIGSGQWCVCGQQHPPSYPATAENIIAVEPRV